MELLHFYMVLLTISQHLFPEYLYPIFYSKPRLLFHLYIEHKCGFFEIESQLFFDEGDKQFDCLNVIGVTGNKEELWFDVTDYYGMDDD